jgi:multidrug resistance efflux pump
MLIVIVLYILAIWLVFFKLKVLPFNWPWRFAVFIAGIGIVGVFLGLLNTLVPQGRLIVYGKVAEIAPNVAGTVTAVPIQPNVRVSAGTVLFTLDAIPYRNRVNEMQAALADAEQRAARLTVDLAGAAAEVQGLSAQLAFAVSRRDDLERLARSNASSEFRLQDAAAQVDSISAQLQASRSKQESLRIAAESEIGGENALVAQTRARFEQAKWELEQTIVRAPADGFATNIGLVTGARTTPLRSAMTFVHADDQSLAVVLPQNGLGAVKPGARVSFVLNSAPGVVFETTVESLLSATGEGQTSASGALTAVSALRTSDTYPARLKVPAGMTPEQFRPGVSGFATVFHEKAGPIAILGTILTHIAAWLAYL